MFCPICKAEYRLGFTQCSDCQVPLVETLPDERADPTSGTDTDATPTAVKLWDGSDFSAFAAIREALRDASIAYEGPESRAPLWGKGPQQPFTIWVQKQDEDAAREILADVLGENELPDTEETSEAGTEEEQNEADAQAGAAEDESTGEAAPDDIVEDFHPDDATSEVWSGTDKQMADDLKMCLGEIGIGCVMAEDGDKVSVLVLPSSESRAKEIVRQVIDAAPPQ